jgi:hypothetical protein
MRLLAAIITAVCLASAAAFADPVGQYNVTGTNPGNTNAVYKGTVAVQRTGETYQVVWVVGGARFVGTGIGVDTANFLAVAYKSKNFSGLALYAGQPDGSWQGIWTTEGGTLIGSEKWTPR